MPSTRPPTRAPTPAPTDESRRAPRLELRSRSKLGSQIDSISRNNACWRVSMSMNTRSTLFASLVVSLTALAACSSSSAGRWRKHLVHGHLQPPRYRFQRAGGRFVLRPMLIVGICHAIMRSRRLDVRCRAAMRDRCPAHRRRGGRRPVHHGRDAPAYQRRARGLVSLRTDWPLLHHHGTELGVRGRSHVRWGRRSRQESCILQPEMYEGPSEREHQRLSVRVLVRHGICQSRRHGQLVQALVAARPRVSSRPSTRSQLQ